MGLEIMKTFEKLNSTPQEVTDPEIAKLSEELDGNLDALGARKNDVLGGVSRMIEQAQEAIRQAGIDKNETAKATAVERLNLLRGMETKLISAGATKPIQDRGISARDLVGQGGSVGTVVGSSVEMTAKNFGLLVAKHPWLTLGGLGLGTWLYKGTGSKEKLDKQPWYKRLPIKVATAALALVGVNWIAQSSFPNEAATLEKKKPYDEGSPEQERKLAA